MALGTTVAPRRVRSLFVLSALLVLFSTASNSDAELARQKNPDRADGIVARQPEAGPAPEIVPLWTDFLARAEASAASWNPRGGTPQSVFGRLSEAGEASETEARRFLKGHAPLFKLDPELRDLALLRAVESPLGRHLVFRQAYRGVPVFGSEVKVHFNRAGEIVAVNNTYVPGIELETVRPALSVPQAIRIARRSAAYAGDGEELPGRARAALGVFAGESAASLAWEVTITTDGPTWRIYVDASSGGLLAAPIDVNRYVSGTGRVFRVNAVVATQDNTLTDQDDTASAVPESSYSAVVLQGLAGTGQLDGDFASSSRTKKRVSSPTHDFLFDRASDGFSEVMGYYYLDYAQRYIQSLGFTDVNNRQQVFAVNRLKVDNSFYSPNSGEISLGTGGVDDAEDADVIVHEYGHSIQDDQVPGFGTTLEAGSMGEGFSDYWAGTVGAQLSGGFQDECLAEWDATSYSSTSPPCLRRLDGTKHYPEDVVGQVHADGEIWSAALWQIRSAIGALQADRAVLQAHFLLTPGASFNEGANALVTAAINLGYSRRDVESIRTILRARGFTVTA